MSDDEERFQDEGEKPERKVVWISISPEHRFMQLLGKMADVDYLIYREFLRALATNDVTDSLGGPELQYLRDWVDDREAVWDELRYELEQFQVDYRAKLEAAIVSRLREPDRKQCEVCERWFIPVRSTAKYCSAPCRQKSYRIRTKGPVDGRI